MMGGLSLRHPTGEADCGRFAGVAASERRGVSSRLIRDEGRHDWTVAEYEQKGWTMSRGMYSGRTELTSEDGERRTGAFM